MTAVIQSHQSVLTGQTSKTLTFAATQAGNSIVVECAIRAVSSVFSGFTVSDGANTYVSRKVLTNAFDQRIAAIIDCLGASSITSLTLTPVGGSGGMLGCFSFQEVSGITALDQSGSIGYASSPLVVACSAMDAGSTDFVAAAISAGNNLAASGITDPPATYTSAAVNQNDSGFSGGGECCYRINTSALTNTASWGITGGAGSGDPAVIVSYQSIILPVSPIPAGARQTFVTETILQY